MNRGGGDLCMQLAWATPDDGYDARRIVEVSVDGQRRTVDAGETLVLKPGQGVPAAALVSSLLGGEGVRAGLGNLDGQ